MEIYASAGWQTGLEWRRSLIRLVWLPEQARELIESGFPWKLGQLFNMNHSLLCELGVSSNELDLLVAAARNAGALGAKLSGGGRGGNMIALIEADNENKIIQALVEAGAVRTIATTIRTSGSN